MGIKVDANPGETTKTSVLPDRIGNYDVRCAELCGLLHADMETKAHVVSGVGLQSMARQQRGARLMTEGTAFMSRHCHE